MRRPEAHAWLLVTALAACGDEASTAHDAGSEAPDAGPSRDGGGEAPSDAGPEPDAFADASEVPSVDAGAPAEVYATAVHHYEPGANAGFGQQNLPDVVLGPPQGGGTNAGSLDVLSLGVGGSIVVDLGERGVVDGPGPDLIVFENPFWPGGDETRVFAELGEVSVSEDAVTWFTFACDTTGEAGRYPGCAGFTPTRMYDPRMAPLDPALTGGDTFDLATLGQNRARYVRIRDLSTTGAGDNAGFDLDAVGVIHPGP